MGYGGIGGIGAPIGRPVGDIPLQSVYLLTAVDGTFALTGEAALFDVHLNCTFGSLVLTGENAILSDSRPVAAGDFALTGEAALFQVTFDLNAHYGSPAGIGSPIGRMIGGAPLQIYHHGTFALDVFDAILTPELVANQAGYVIDGIDSSFFFELPIVGSDDIQFPINCILAKQQLYKARYRDVEIFPLRRENKPVGRRSTVSRIKGKAPSFTTRTDSKGYD